MSEFVAKFSAVLMGVLIILLVHAAIVGVSGLWKLFIRAGKPVWLAFIPVVNILVLWQIAHVLTLGVLVSLSCCITYFIQDYFLFEGYIPKTTLGLVITLLGYFLPLFFLNLCLSFRLSKLFGYGTGFALGLTFLWPFWLVFYWGSSRAQDNPDYGWFSLVDDGGSDFEFSLALRYLRPKRTAVSFICSSTRTSPPSKCRVWCMAQSSLEDPKTFTERRFSSAGRVSQQLRSCWTRSRMHSSDRCEFPSCLTQMVPTRRRPPRC